MILKVLGSGSTGNCYLLLSDTECLVIEAGISFTEVKKALDFKISKITGLIVSHGHTDHSQYIKNYRKAGIKVFTPYDDPEKGQIKYFGNFMVHAFPLTDSKGQFVHTNTDDTECPCYGFLITHPEIGRMIYATDCGFVKWRFKNINHMLVECNYSDEIFDTNLDYKNHIISGHMSLNTCKEFVRTNNANLKTVTLCHLSHTNSDETMFARTIQTVVNDDCYVDVARAGKEIILKGENTNGNI